jgi:hypothetical protein
MPPAFLKSAKAKVDQKEVQVRGGKWRAEVCTDPDATDAQWKPFDEWKAQYEPPKPPKKEDSERKKKAKADGAEKLKTTLLSKLTNGVSAKLLVILLEVTSKLLTKVENEARAASDLMVIVPMVLNAMNGIVLAYRFDTKKANSKKFAYLRRVGSDQLSNLIEQGTKGAEDAGQQIIEMQSEITRLVKSKQGEARMLASGMLDDLIVTAGETMDEKVETELPLVVGKLADMEVQADAVLSASGMSRPEQSPTDIDASDLKDKKDQVVDQLGVFLKQLVLGEMDRLTEGLTYGIDQVFEEFSEIFSRVVKFKDEKDAGLEEGLRDEIFGMIEKFYKQSEEKISTEVKSVVDMLGSMMDNKESEDIEQEDDE